LLKSGLEKFIAKRAAIFYIILVILDLVIVRERWAALAGLTIGGVSGLFKFSSMASVFSALAARHSQLSPALLQLLKYLVNMTGVIILVGVSLKLNMWLFWGVLSGILLVPSVIMVNGLTEALGITHNGFK